MEHKAMELMARLLTRLEREGIENADTVAARELITTDWRDPVIAAAPELLAALKQLSLAANHKERVEAMSLASFAIAKAEGED